ncbi:hypothetical protein [Bacteroides sp. An51A]|uniref:hypothetical protein n=1 Tax=Bacteroides sp. An51A TaxID=1965640 RepID=UPI0011787F33|nr:hypothetical protein [Bacteroides sp. An51A]
MSRVALDDTDLGDDSQPTDMKVWIFEHGTGNRLAYITETQPVFSGSDALGELVNTKEYVVEVENEIQALDFYVVLNSENGTGLNLEEAATPSQIKEATFTGVKANLKDNQVPAYGCLENFDVSKHRNSYDVPAIKLTRAVGKLELFFTKENENSELMIKKVTLTKLPDKGYLVKPETYSLNYSDDPRTLFESEEEKGTEITAVLTETDASLGDFSQYQDDASKLQSLMSAYLLENPDGGKWAGTEDDGNLDYTYPENLTNVTDNRYVMTVNYSIGGTDKMQVVYLPAIERNVWNKIFARVKGGTLQIQYKAMPWETVVTSIGYAPQPVFPDEEGKTVFDSDDRYESEDYYVLLPKKEYDGKDTRSLMYELYTEAKSGDPEAVLCYVCRPGYVDNSKVDNLTYLKDGSGGARFYFMLTGPEGATWEAHLNDPEGNFAFSTTFEDSEFEDNADGYPVGVYKVTHGIARLKPYVIQIIATHNYTGTTDNPKQEGTESEVKYPEITTPAGNQEWGDKTYFGNNYLTTWGEKQWNDKNVISAEFYITVKLTDGTEYELDINPSYNGYNQKAFSDEGFYYKDNRRYAGTDTRIWIRQLRAQYNGEHGIKNYVDMAKHVDERSEDEWWRVNPYWNTDNE